nr:immunoglobulin heavy chain junction region [Macaca mulatta]
CASRHSYCTGTTCYPHLPFYLDSW